MTVRPGPILKLSNGRVDYQCPACLLVWPDKRQYERHRCRPSMGTVTEQKPKRKGGR